MQDKKFKDDDRLPPIRLDTAGLLDYHFTACERYGHDFILPSELLNFAMGSVDDFVIDSCGFNVPDGVSACIRDYLHAFNIPDAEHFDFRIYFDRIFMWDRRQPLYHYLQSGSDCTQVLIPLQRNTPNHTGFTIFNLSEPIEGLRDGQIIDETSATEAIRKNSHVIIGGHWIAEPGDNHKSISQDQKKYQVLFNQRSVGVTPDFSLAQAWLDIQNLREAAQQKHARPGEIAFTATTQDGPVKLSTSRDVLYTICRCKDNVLVVFIGPDHPLRQIVEPHLDRSMNMEYFHENIYQEYFRFITQQLAIYQAMDPSLGAMQVLLNHGRTILADLTDDNLLEVFGHQTLA